MPLHSPERASGLCKGIYVEPESIQFRDDQDVRVSFVQTLETLLDGGCYAAIATHDEWLVDRALEVIAERGLGPDAYEFQMLLGVRPELGDRIVAAGHRLRIYVPYGRQWYEYSLRRLEGEPENRRLRRRRFRTSDLPQALAPTEAAARAGLERLLPPRPRSPDVAARRCAPGHPRRTWPDGWNPPQLDQKIIEMTRPRMPTIRRMTPIAFTSRPSASAVTPHVSTAPTAIKRMLTAIPIAEVVSGSTGF